MTYTCIARCRTCGAELNRATGVPKREMFRINVSATTMCLCKERAHNTGSDFNLNLDLEWLPEPETVAVASTSSAEHTAEKTD